MLLFFVFAVVDGNWADWSSWSTCSKTCKQGKQSRTRECTAPAPQYGGKPCDGKPSEIRICNKDVPCPGKKFVMYNVVFS